MKMHKILIHKTIKSLRSICTLKQHGSLAKIPRHQQQKQCLLPEARIRLVWTGDENVQEHQQCEQALFFLPAIDPKHLDKH